MKAALFAPIKFVGDSFFPKMLPGRLDRQIQKAIVKIFGDLDIEVLASDDELLVITEANNSFFCKWFSRHEK